MTDQPMKAEQIADLKALLAKWEPLEAIRCQKPHYTGDYFVRSQAAENAWTPLAAAAVGALPSLLSSYEALQAELAQLRHRLEIIGLCPKCGGTHKDRHPGACNGPVSPARPPHRMQG
jgi:hypothetical protein